MPITNVRIDEVPDWDLAQLEVIMDDPSSWQLVVAGPEPVSRLSHANVLLS
jgi:hypothetical protein